ncbi:MAG: electron transfer flavoprotein subunit alpha/FixB family protein [Oscillospiraceae bacterium]|nr:electron transfer flavoprotein subunit alpha/FixB family protein [Oscillospiraceae bacterium]
MEKNREIWVVIETTQGQPCSTSLELFTPARELAQKTGGSVTAVVLAADASAMAQTAAELGADRVITAADPALAEYSAFTYTAALYQLVKKYEPDAVMISASRNGKDFAPRLAARLKTGITANTTALDADPETGLISWMMPAPGGIMATILCRKTRPQMGTVCPGVFKKPQAEPGRQVPVVAETVTLATDVLAQRVSRFVPEESGEVNIADAEIIVAGGRGMGSEENFGLVRQLADALGGVVGASRAAVDLEWADESCMVGQTGKVVHPKLYIACGISGALQHLVGVGADFVVAINSDPEAPIFEIADIGIVGDVTKVLPALTEQVLKAKEA